MIGGMRFRVLASLAFLGAVLPVFGQSVNPTIQPPNLSNLQLNRWQLLNSSLLKARPVVALEAKSTTFKPSFPEQTNNRSLYSSPAGPVTFRMCLDGLTRNRFQVAFQIASTPASQHAVAPYAGWETPFGLIDSRFIEIVTQTNTQGGISFPNQPGVQMSPISASQRAAEFTVQLPTPQLAIPGAIVFARVVPFEVQNGKRVAIGPSSNWVQLNIAGTPQQQADAQALAAAKAKAAAEGNILVAKAAEAQKAIRDNYEIRLLSYIPPKFFDDAGAENYFDAHTAVTIPYDKGTKIVNLGSGETYSVSYIRNLIQSNKTWGQQLWDVTSAALNQQNAFFQAAKMGVVNGICLGIEASTGVKVGAEVRAAMLMGINFALAYCGIPPSLPNIDQLYNQGVDYLAATIADYALEQATGVAMDEFGANPMMTMAARDAVRERAKQETAKLIEALTKPAPFDNVVPETWGTPSEFYRRRPAMVYLEIRLRPGGRPVVGQTWQGISLQFLNNQVFANAEEIALPRTVGQRLRVPIALATNREPKSWPIAGYMPRKGVAPGFAVGQPFYVGVPTARVNVVTHHRLLGSGQAVQAFMNSFEINSNLVNAIPLPDQDFMSAAQGEAAINSGKVALGPANYVGRTSYRPFTAP